MKQKQTNDKLCALMKEELTGDGRVWKPFPRPILVTKQELIAYQLKWALWGVVDNLSEKELLVLALVHMHGGNAVEECVKQGLYTSEISVRNLLVKYRKLEVIIGSGKTMSLHPHIIPYEGDLTFTVKLKLIDGKET